MHGSRFQLNVRLLEKYEWQSFEAAFRKTELIVQEELIQFLHPFVSSADTY